MRRFLLSLKIGGIFVDLNSNMSDLHNAPSNLIHTSDFNDALLYNQRTTNSSEPLHNNASIRRCASTYELPYTTNRLLHRRCSSTINLNNLSQNYQHQLHTTNSSDVHMPDDIYDNPMPKKTSFRRTHTRHLSLDMSINNNPVLNNNSFNNKNISLDDISRTRTVPSLTLEHVQKLDDINTIDRSIPMDIASNASISLTDNALLCLKILACPISLFFHIGRLAFASISTTFSFATAFAISDLIFFSFLDNFDLSSLRYVLLGITGIVAAFSIKGVVSSSINLFLSIFKGTYSWYFSLIDPECSFSDFLLGINEITMNKS